MWEICQTARPIGNTFGTRISTTNLAARACVCVWVRQIVCPVIPGTPKSVVGPLDILPGCSVGTLDLALAVSVNITAIVALSQTRDRVMFRQVQ